VIMRSTMIHLLSIFFLGLSVNLYGVEFHYEVTDALVESEVEKMMAPYQDLRLKQRWTLIYANSSKPTALPAEFDVLESGVSCLGKKSYVQKSRVKKDVFVNVEKNFDETISILATISEQCKQELIDIKRFELEEQAEIANANSNLCLLDMREFYLLFPNAELSCTGDSGPVIESGRSVEPLIDSDDVCTEATFCPMPAPKTKVLLGE